MTPLNFLSIAIFLALGVFSLLQFYIVFCSSKYKVWKLNYKYDTSKFNKNLTVVVYSHNNAEAIVELLENLKKQEYPLDKVKINIILDNCTDNSSNLLEILGGAKIWRIATGQKSIGRDAAFEWFLDRTLAVENTNAFVFLDAQNKINPLLLSNINNAIGEFSVVTGKIEHSTKNPILAQIIDLYDKLNYNINLEGRSMAGLSNLASTEILAIRQEILEKIRFINIKNQNTGMLYSMLLTKAGIPVVYSDDITVFKRDESTLKTFIIEKHKEFIDKLKTFKYSCRLLGESINPKSKELILSLLYPNDATMVVLFSLLVVLSLFCGPTLNDTIVRYLLSFCLIAVAYTIVLSKLSWLNILVWPLKIITSPMILLGRGINILKFDGNLPKFEFKKPSFKFEMPKIQLPKLGKTGPKNASNVFVTNGTRDIPCQLEIEDKDGLYASILWFNNKKICSNKFLRASDSLAELSEKLFDKGFALKVCQNCGYFEPSQDGKHDLIAGSCLLAIVKHGRKEPYSTQISNSCKFIIPAHAKEYVRKQIQDLQKD